MEESEREGRGEIVAEEEAEEGEEEEEEEEQGDDVEGRVLRGRTAGKRRWCLR